MPRYLGRDYLSEHLKEKLRNQEDILRLQLPNPGHLQVQGSYVHCGILPDEVYRKPWQRVKLEKHQLPTDEGKVTQHGLVGLHISSSDLETLNRDFQGICVNNFSDIVPSSNPGSQESVCNGTTGMLWARKREIDDITSESFAHFSLQGDEQTEEEFSLEEVQGAHKLDYFVRSLPSVEGLVKRLRPLAVQDPLRSDENHVLGLDRVYAPQSKNLQKADEVPKNAEVISRIETCNFDSGLLEDKLTLDEEKNTHKSFLNSHRRDFKEALGHLSEERLDDAGNITSISLGLLRHTEERKLQGLINVNIPEVLESKCKNRTSNFNEINNEGLEKDGSSVWERCCLESPAIAHFSITTLDILPWKDLEELPHDKSGDWLVLETKKKNALELSLWLNQKFHDSRFMHRLREPDTRDAFGNRPTFKDICQLLDLEPQVCDELHLPWVPVDYCDVASTAVVTVEPFSDQKSYLLMETQLAGVEGIFKQDLCSFLKETDTDEALPAPLFEKNMFKAVKRKGIENTVEEAGDGPRRMKLGPPEVIKLPVAAPPVSADPLDSFLWIKQQKSRNRSHNPSGAESQQLKQRNSGNGPGGTLKEKQGKQNLEKSTFSKRDVSSSKPKPAAPTATQDVASSNTPLYNVDVARVQVTGGYLEPSLLLRDGAKPLLQKLQSHGLLPSNQSLSALTPAITRFILKQHEKSREMARGEEGQENSGYAEVYSIAVGLHALVDALHSLLHGCLPLAAAQMAEVQQRYGVLPHGLEKLHHSLFETHMQFEEQHVRHPKILTICERLSRWMTKETNSTTGKVMVIMNRRSSCLANTIKEGLMMVEGLQPNIYPLQEEMTPTQVTKMLETCNCLIISGPQVTGDFLLAQFTFVVEYEHTERSNIKKACQEANINYLGLELDTKAVFMREEMGGSNSSGMIQQDGSPEVVLIGSHNVTRDSQLLHILEGRNNILVVERDYQDLVKPGSQIGFADLIVDECSCIVLQSIADLGDIRSASPLILQLAHLSNKYVNCWLILHSHNAKERSKQKYPYAGVVPSTLARLHSGISHLSAAVQGYNIQVLHSTSAERTGDLVRQIAVTASVASEVWTKEEWIERTWISLVMSKYERFLLQIPCISSFSAQILLKTFTVDKLFTASLPELVKHCPWLSPRILQAFWQYLHSDIPVANEVPSSQYPIPSHIGGGDHAGGLCSSPDMKEHRVSKGGCNLSYQVHKEDCLVERQDMLEKGRNTLAYQHDSLDTRGEPNQVSQGHEMIKTLPSQIDLTSPVQQESQTFKGYGQEISPVIKTKQHRYRRDVTSKMTGEETDGLMEKKMSVSVEPSRFYDSVEFVPDIEHVNSEKIGQQMPNEFERACLEHQSERLENAEEFQFRLNPSVQQMKEDHVAQEFDTEVTTPEKKFLPTMSNKRSFVFDSGKYLSTPLKVPKVEILEDNRPINSDITKPDFKYGSHPTMRMYPENNANKYRNYPNRTDIHLWTQFGDHQQKRTGYQRKTTYQPTQEIMQSSLQLELSEQNSKYSKESHQKGDGAKTKLNFTHRYSGSKVSGSVSRNSNTAKAETMMKEDTGDVEKRARRSLAACDIARGIAPVTPKVRHPVHILQLSDEHVHRRDHTRGSWEQRTGVPDAGGDSPPMDLSQGDQDLDFYRINSSRMIEDQMVPGTTVHRLNNVLDGISVMNHSHVEYEPKRKLVYQRVPGAPKGQTRLSFE